MKELLFYDGAVVGTVKYIDNFDMKELGRQRRIWIYLPKDYDESNLSYPVLYMHDGQNLFDEKISYCGEWEVDDTLENLANKSADRGIIVVGVESGTHRNTELVPGCPDCDSYIEFIVHTLKPYIDANFRTIPWREQTGIMGSSFGGQTSIYAALRFPEIFGLVGAFSPSLFVDKRLVETYPLVMKTRYYICAGASEAEGCLPEIALRFTPNVCEVAEVLKESGHDIELSIDEDGVHNEKYWARKFPEAYNWLFTNAW